MDILINETQIKKLLVESKSEEVSKRVKISRNFAYSVIKQSKKQISNNLEFLLTWGSSIGGVMHPLNEFISGEYPELNHADISLIIVGAVSIVFFNNKEVFDEVKSIIKEKGMTEVLKSAVNKSEELKNVFYKFIGSLNMSLHQMTNIISYAFIIPILPLIYDISMSEEVSSGQINLIVKRIASSVSVAISGILLKELIGKLIKRFSKGQ